ncbi:TerB family tellurite resistance protein [Microvirga puerhi]|uniref:TerB family tellurite resistance protein n=1 Tax=Microvirga puerhi TaxID=2876078 RepID=A0ABS7VJT5_9HYPH|nr:TerB family tellurite resistance protein [Microvirga puerhi]MBZ6075786.1 TerB family tellurite resistance protein [Microvirga puerhi]
MSFMSYLRDFFEAEAAPEGGAEHGEPFTVAALLTWVTHADGRVLKVEEEALRTLLQSRFGLSEIQAERLIVKARDIGGALDPATTLVDRIAQDLPPSEWPRLMALAYQIAAVDGHVHEFEDDLIWRTGRRLGLSDAELGAIKRDALKAPETGMDDA